MLQMKKQMEILFQAFRKRIEVEINYSKSLTQVSKTLDKYIKPGTELASSYISSAFKFSTSSVVDKQWSWQSLLRHRYSPCALRC